MLRTSVPPVPATALIGRATEVAAIRDLLAAPGTRLVTLTGPPGVGKTRLALAVAEVYDDVAWVDLAPVHQPRLVMIEVARALGLSAAADLPAAVERDVLLIVDNCEHLFAAMPELGDLLAATSRLRVLATSRERLRLAAEREYAVPPLPMPVDSEIEDWGRLRCNPAVAMLLARAPAHVDLNRDAARALADVCIRLDGMPLAIELAAARLRVFTPAELAFRLERRMTVLTGGARDLPERHRDLCARSRGVTSCSPSAIASSSGGCRSSPAIGPWQLLRRCVPCPTCWTRSSHCWTRACLVASAKQPATLGSRC